MNKQQQVLVGKKAVRIAKKFLGVKHAEVIDYCNMREHQCDAVEVALEKIKFKTATNRMLRLFKNVKGVEIIPERKEIREMFTAKYPFDHEVMFVIKQTGKGKITERSYELYEDANGNVSLKFCQH